LLLIHKRGNMYRILNLGLALLVFFAALPPAVAQSESEVQAVREHFEEGDPGMQAWFREAYAYAVFPSVGKGGFGIGGAHGKGLVYEQGNLVAR